MNPQTILYAIALIGGAALAIYTTYREFQSAPTYGEYERPNSSQSSRNDKRKKLRGHYQSRQEDDCSICLSSMMSGHLVVIECRHTFHKKCIMDWMKEKKVCPMCRATIPSL